MRVVVTGATGFVGRALVPALEKGRHVAIAPPRAAADLAEPAGFGPLLRGADALVHLAAYNPPRWQARFGDAKRFRALNVEATAVLGRMALEAGVRTFVFLSSARVYGIQNLPLYREDTTPNPNGAYGLSKWEAEKALAEIFSSAPDRLLVLRAPVIYGPGRGGVIGLVERFARAGLPFPDAFATPEKSVLYILNLVSAVRNALERKKPLSGVFNICDGAPVTLGELGATMAQQYGKQFRTVSLPGFVLRAIAVLPVIGPATVHLAAPCVLEGRLFAQAADWTPPFGTFDAI